MPVATPPNALRPLSPEESRLLDVYVDAECDFRAFRDAANLSTSEALDFLRSIPEYLEALEIQMSSAWNRFTISRKTNVIRVLEQVIAENRDNPVERRRAATAILRAIHPPRQRAPESPTFTPSPVQPDRVPPTPPRQRPRDPVSEAIIARADIQTLRAKIAAVETQHSEQPATPQPRSHRHARAAQSVTTDHWRPAEPRSPQTNSASAPAPLRASSHASPAPSPRSLAYAGGIPHCRDPAA